MLILCGISIECAELIALELDLQVSLWRIHFDQGNCIVAPNGLNVLRASIRHVPFTKGDVPETVHHTQYDC